MSLLTTDITKVNRLSLKEGKLHTSERRVDHITQIRRPPTDEEIAYSKIVDINPQIEELVDSLDMVSKKTGKRINKIELRERDRIKLITLAQKIIERDNSYTKEEVIDRIREATNVSKERAERGFILMLKVEAIEITPPGDRYYLIGSTK